MTYMVGCRRCGVAYDFDANRSTNPHGHAAEPSPRTHPAGTRVRLIHDAAHYADVIPAGTTGTVIRYSPEHHSQNGGGYTVDVALGPGVTRNLWSVWLEVIA